MFIFVLYYSLTPPPPLILPCLTLRLSAAWHDFLDDDTVAIPASNAVNGYGYMSSGFAGQDAAGLGFPLAPTATQQEMEGNFLTSRPVFASEREAVRPASPPPSYAELSS
jgi:hypothetical protein